MPLFSSMLDKLIDVTSSVIVAGALHVPLLMSLLLTPQVVTPSHIVSTEVPKISSTIQAPITQKQQSSSTPVAAMPSPILSFDPNQVSFASTSYTEIALKSLKPGDNRIGNAIITLLVPTKIDNTPTAQDPNTPAYMQIGRSNVTKYFLYHGYNYKEEYKQTGGGGTGGESFVGTYFVQNVDGSWRQLFALNSWGVDMLFGYGDSIIAIDTWRWHLGASDTTFGGEIALYNPVASTSQVVTAEHETLENSYTTFNTSLYPYDSQISLISHNKGLFARVKLQYCYYSSCADGFYSLENGKIVDNHQQFGAFYLQEAKDYQALIPKYGSNWLDALVGRTIQIVLAGDSKYAWSAFKQDFDTLLAAYPGSADSDARADLIEQDVEQKLTNQLNVVDSYPDVPSDWIPYVNNTWGITFKTPPDATIQPIMGGPTLQNQHLLQINVKGEGYFLIISNSAADGQTVAEKDCLQNHFVLNSIKSSDQTLYGIISTFKCN